jgi:carbamoyl-phosphate synthase small subunit
MTETSDPDAGPQLTGRPADATGALVLADGSVFWGKGLGARTKAVGEVCFNTSLTGYQEILTDPSYAGQIISFTFPHIGNVGTNPEDLETATPASRGCVLRAEVSAPSSWRALARLDDWLGVNRIPGLSGVDTRRLTRRIRMKGPPSAVIVHAGADEIDVKRLAAEASAWPGLEGMDLAKDVTCRQAYEWNETRWTLGRGFGRLSRARHHVVAIDYGAKRNILRSLASLGCRVSVVPADASFEDIARRNPDGIFLSNGPGDPAATGTYAVPLIQKLMATGVPIFGICLGHQLLALALGGRTAKMHQGHRGANHPVKDLASGRVEITSQNHGFVVVPESLPAGVAATHVSLFDGSLEGLKVEARPIFSVQYHPEASPGPQDSQYLFQRFVDLMDAHA